MNYLRCQKLYGLSRLLTDTQAASEAMPRDRGASNTCTMSSLLPPLLRIDRTRYYTHTDMIDLDAPLKIICN